MYSLDITINLLQFENISENKFRPDSVDHFSFTVTSQNRINLDEIKNNIRDFCNEKFRLHADT